MIRRALAFLIVLGLCGTLPLLAQKPPQPTSAAASEVINLNTATAAQIATLPGIGLKTAELIVQYRQKTPFRKIEEIMNVRGIGEKSFLRIKAQLTVAPLQSEK